MNGPDERDEDFAEEYERAANAWLRATRSMLQEELKRRSKKGTQSAAVEEFVKACMVTLGRLPARKETAKSWAAKGVAPQALDDEATRRSLGMIQEDEVNGHRVRVFFNSPRQIAAGGALDRQPGWFLIVLDPDPSWTFNEPVGPCLTAGEAWSMADEMNAEPL